MPHDPAQSRPESSRTDPSADFSTDLFIADRDGIEFASMKRARIVAPSIGGMLFVPIVGLTVFGYGVLVGLLGVPRVAAAVACGGLGGAALVLAYANFFRAGSYKSPGWSAFSTQSTDTRYRLRAVIPKAQRSKAMARWAMRVTGIEEEHYPEPGQQFDAERGGFEPLIVRPWLGVSRGRGYRVVVYSVGCVLGVLFLAFAHFSIGSIFEPLRGLRAWGVIALIAGCSLGAAESLYPVFVRLAPGRLDVFRYRFLGRGSPRVTTYDLKAVGLCVNFQTATLAIEPPRPAGEPLPKLVLSKKWPHFQEHASGQRPDYISVALYPGRIEFCQRLIQAARTTEPTPPLPDDRLLG